MEQYATRNVLVFQLLNFFFANHLGLSVTLGMDN